LSPAQSKNSIGGVGVEHEDTLELVTGFSEKREHRSPVHSGAEERRYVNVTCRMSVNQYAVFKLSMKNTSDPLDGDGDDDDEAEERQTVGTVASYDDRRSVGMKSRKSVLRHFTYVYWPHYCS
jgi:hypothetical protein